MKIWDRYVLVRFLATFFATLFLLVIVITLSELTTRMNSIMTSKADPIHFYLYLLYRIPRFTSFAVPVALMFSITFSITQLSRTNELLAIMASGWSYLRTIASAIIAGVLLSLLLFIFNETMVGNLEYKSQLEWKKVRGLKDISEKTIFNMHIKGQDTFYYFQSFYPKKQKFKHIHFIRLRKDKTPLYEVRAKKAKWKTKKNDWAFYKGSIRKYSKNLDLLSETKFKKAYFKLKDKPKLFQVNNRHPDAMDLKYLNSFIPMRKKAGLNVKAYKILWHERFSIPFVGIVVIFIGAIVGKILKKATVASSLGITILVVLFYFVVQSLGKSLAKDAILPIGIGVWLANILFTTATLFFGAKKLR